MDDKTPGYITSFSLHAIEAIIGHKKRFEVISEFLSFVETHPFLLRYSTNTEQERKISGLASTWKLDFDDALQFFVAKANRLTLVTFDRDFYKVKGVKVLFPA